MVRDMNEQNTLDKLRLLIANLERWREHIEEALRHGRHTHNFDDIVGMILANRILFFAFDECFTIMEKVDYPRFSVFHCFLAGGKLEAVLDAETAMKAVGQTLGCKFLSMAGRKGWVRSLEQRGWKHVSTAMYVPIGEPDEQWERWGAVNDSQAAQRH